MVNAEALYIAKVEKNTHINFMLGCYTGSGEKKGRGTREIFYEKDEPVLVEGIFEWGKKAIFPNGKSQHGLLSSIEVCLSNYVSERIDTFQTTEGEECSLQEYLKSCGMFSSQFYIY